MKSIHLLPVCCKKWFNIYNNRISSGLYSDPNGIHGICHSRRVLLLVLLLLQAEKVDPKLWAVMGETAIFHDIGRRGDGEGRSHGLFSVRMLKRYKLSMLSERQFWLMNQLIIYHCQEDSEGIDALRNNAIDDKEKQLFILCFSIFKDADALDRVRIRDLDPAYLRLSTSVELIPLAYDLIESDEWYQVLVTENT